MLFTPSSKNRPVQLVPASLLIQGAEQASSNQIYDPSVGLFGSVAATATRLTVSTEYHKKMLQYSVCLPSTSIQLCSSHSGASGVRKGFLQARTTVFLANGATEHVPLPEREARCYSQNFTVPKKDRVLHPILDLKGLNRTLRTYRFKILTQTHSVTNPIQGLVCDDRSKGHLLSHRDSDKTQEVSQVCFQE